MSSVSDFSSIFHIYTRLIISIKSVSPRSNSMDNLIKHSYWWMTWCTDDTNPCSYWVQNPQNHAYKEHNPIFADGWNSEMAFFEQNAVLEIISSWKFPIHLADRRCRCRPRPYIFLSFSRDRSTWDQYVEIAFFVMCPAALQWRYALGCCNSATYCQ